MATFILTMAIMQGRQLKDALAAEREAIFRAHRAGASGGETSRCLTHAVDTLLRDAWDSLGDAAVSTAAVIAVGGYGRGELSPRSDIDIMILCDNGNREPAEDAARKFLHILWDTGVDLGHAVRTPDDIASLYGQSAEVWAGMLEGRFVCGSRNLALACEAQLKGLISGGSQEWFVGKVLEDLRSRHGRYGNSVKLLEPNVKKSAGALRDLHTLLWLYRGTDSSFFPGMMADPGATGSLLDMLCARGLLDDARRDAVAAAADFLLRVRHEMHYQRETLHDTLEYGLQLKVAKELQYSDGGDESAAVELFMRQYYLHARVIDQAGRRLCRDFRAMLEPAPSGGTALPVGSAFLLRDRVLTVRPEVRSLTEAHQVLEAFLAAAEHDAELDFRAQGLIEAAQPLFTGETAADPDLAAMFRRILAGRRVGYSLRMMNDLNILGSYIPEFGNLVAFFQHNVYHYFTADEHTVIAVENAELLREAEGVLHDVHRSLRRKDHLSMAILLHDIAKPQSVRGHEVLGVEVARTVLGRIGMSDAFPLVSFLIRNHLVMEQTAFRRNVHDPQTIREFSARFESPEQLDYLYVLTYADLSAVNMTVWTDWKASILRDLYLRTSEVLRKQLSGTQIDQLHASRREAAVEQVVTELGKGMSEDDVRRHLEGIANDAYISQFSEQEIAEHIREGKEPGSVSTLFRNGHGYTEVTVIGKDAPYVLARCCAVLSANDANIFDANIFTRDDGVFIDHFRVTDRGGAAELSRPVSAKIREDITKVLEGLFRIDDLFAAHRRKWKRRKDLPANPKTRMDVEFVDNPRFTILDVFAPDSIGFLYRMTEAISGLGLDIHFARIATRIDGVVDAFYVRDQSGRPLSPGAERDRIRERLIGTIREIAAEQLSEEDA